MQAVFVDGRINERRRFRFSFRKSAAPPIGFFRGLCQGVSGTVCVQERHPDRLFCTLIARFVSEDVTGAVIDRGIRDFAPAPKVTDTRPDGRLGPSGDR
jgi:hypothetical protein